MASAPAGKALRHGMEMRAFFEYPKIAVTSWFPRHMFAGMLKVQGKLHGIDGVVEVHDARVPFTGRNKRLTDIGIIKPSLLVLNKADLVDPKQLQQVKESFSRTGVDVLFTKCKESGNAGIRNLVPTLLKNISGADRYNRSGQSEYNIMVIGVPNVGKSSIINALRNQNTKRKSCAAVGPVPGVTRTVMERIQVLLRPAVYCRDTPGVLAPRIPGMEGGLRLALAGLVQDSMLGKQLMADYLLYWFNSRGRREYVQELQLPSPTDDIRQLLVTIAVRNNLIKINAKEGKSYPDLEEAASHFIELWRKGRLGCGMLDDDSLFYY